MTGESILQALWKHSMVTRVGSVQLPTILGEVEPIVTLLGTLWRISFEVVFVRMYRCIYRWKVLRLVEIQD